MLTKLDIHTTVTRNGEEALKVVQEQNFHLILMDLSMPVMNGFTATQHIRKLKDNHNANAPIIALSAHVSREIKDKCKHYKFNEFIEKPIQLNKFKKSLTKWLPIAEEKK